MQKKLQQFMGDVSIFMNLAKIRKNGITSFIKKLNSFEFDFAIRKVCDMPECDILIKEEESQIILGKIVTRAASVKEYTASLVTADTIKRFEALPSDTIARLINDLASQLN